MLAAYVDVVYADAEFAPHATIPGSTIRHNHINMKNGLLEQ